MQLTAVKISLILGRMGTMLASASVSGPSKRRRVFSAVAGEMMTLSVKRL